MRNRETLLENSPFEGPQVTSGYAFNLWEVNNILDALWVQFKEKFGELEKGKNRVWTANETREMDNYKVTIRKFQNIKAQLEMDKQAVTYRAKPFGDKGERLA